MSKVRRRTLIAIAGLGVAGGLWFAPAALADEDTAPPLNAGPCSWMEIGTYVQDTTNGAIYRCEPVAELADPHWMIVWW
jgi:hypothetical protein